jgi:Zn-dependent protease with chaperone function
MRRCVFSRRFSVLLILSLWLVASAGIVFPARAAQAADAQSAAPQSTPAESSAREQSQTEQYTLSHERYEKAVAYSRVGYTLYFVDSFLSLLAMYLLLRLGIAAKIRDIAEDVSDRRWLQCVIFIPCILVIVDLCELPVSVYWHSLSLRYQQSIQGWGSWIWDWSKAELLTIGFSVVLLLILSAVMRRSPRRWWLYFWFATLPILLGLIFLAPLVIDPLFNQFEPLEKSNPQLVAAIEKLSARAGVPIPPERIFLMKASQKTNQVNAYVTGLGASKRVVIWDTTIQKTTTDEALFIVGHELGHYVLGHVTKGFLIAALGVLAALYLVFRGLDWALDNWAADWKTYGPRDLVSLLVILLLLQGLQFLSAPIVNGVSRMQEHAADVYGLEVIHGIVPNSEEVAAHSFQVLGEMDLSDPNPPPFITFWLYSHPPLADRLVFAHTYDPWSKGESPKYVK